LGFQQKIGKLVLFRKTKKSFIEIQNDTFFTIDLVEGMEELFRAK
jgi:hypothetical protein